MSYAILLTNSFDINQLKKHIEKHYPALEEIRIVYQHLANHLQIAIGSAQGESFEFYLQEFLRQVQITTS